MANIYNKSRWRGIPTKPRIAKSCHTPSAFTGMKSLGPAVADLQHTLKQVQDGDQE